MIPKQNNFSSCNKKMGDFDRSLAVVIGINDYQNGIDQLQTAVPDAIAIAKILKLNYGYELGAALLK